MVLEKEFQPESKFYFLKETGQQKKISKVEKLLF